MNMDLSARGVGRMARGIGATDLLTTTPPVSDVTLTFPQTSTTASGGGGGNVLLSFPQVGCQDSSGAQVPCPDVTSVDVTDTAPPKFNNVPLYILLAALGAFLVIRSGKR